MAVAGSLASIRATYAGNYHGKSVCHTPSPDHVHELRQFALEVARMPVFFSFTISCTVTAISEAGLAGSGPRIVANHTEDAWPGAFEPGLRRYTDLRRF